MKEEPIDIFRGSAAARRSARLRQRLTRGAGTPRLQPRLESIPRLPHLNAQRLLRDRSALERGALTLGESCLLRAFLCGDTFALYNHIRECTRESQSLGMQSALLFGECIQIDGLEPRARRGAAS